MYENFSDSPLFSGGTMKRVLQELKDFKLRLSKVEEEVATLHELIREQNIVNRRDSLSLSPPRILDFAHSLEDDDLRWSHELPQNDYANDSKALQVAMMMNNQAWYGDVFLFEVICQCRGYRPREKTWFNSVFPFNTIESFAKYIQKQTWFHHTCVLSIGYSDLFKFYSLNDKRTKWLLHQILNHMRDYGAERIKVLSLPPARQMMKNSEYLRLCQTNNRSLQNVTDTHPGVDFINLDSFFLRNSDESFTYFEDGEVSIEILDNLLMKKTDDKFFIYVDPDTARCLVDHIVNYTDSSTELPYISRKLKGCVSSSDSPRGHEKVRYDERPRVPLKRRRENSFSYESDERLKSDFHLDRLTPSGSQVESPRRDVNFHYKSPTKYSDRKSPRRHESRFSQNVSPSSHNHSQSTLLNLREETNRHDRRPYSNSYDADDTVANTNVKFYSDSSNRSKRRDDQPFEERIVSKSTTEVRLLRYGERKSPSPSSPPPWLKNAPILASSSRSDRWPSSAHSP